jgi:hypothetical protein
MRFTVAASWLLHVSAARAQEPDVGAPEGVAEEAPAPEGVAEGAPAVADPGAAVRYVTPVGAPDLRDAVVVVRQAGGTCAGAILSDGVVVTAAHCVADGAHARVTSRDGRTYDARVTASRPTDDLALLAVDGLVGAQAIALADAAPQVGEVIEAIGHPYASRPPFGYLAGTLRWSVTRGMTSAVGPTAVQFSAPINPGNSGGPLLDEDGHLVGVVTRKAGEGIGFATRVERVAALLASPRPHGFGGGSIGTFLSSSTLWGPDAAPALGVGLEASLRDRLVWTVEAQLPMFDRWEIEDSGVQTSLPVATTLGVRQRFGQGLVAPRLDAFVGVGALESRVAQIDARPDRSMEATLLVGGRLEWGGWAVEVAALPLATEREVPVRVNVRARLPGKMTF